MSLLCESKVHSPSKCLARVACLWSKMPMFQRAGMKEGRLPLPPAFQYLILITWSTCDSNLVIISSLDSKWQGLKVEMPIFKLFYEMKWKTSIFKVLAFWGQWRYHVNIKITNYSCHKNKILKRPSGPNILTTSVTILYLPANIFPIFFVNDVVCQSNHFCKTYNKAKCYEKGQIFNPW